MRVPFAAFVPPTVADSNGDYASGRCKVLVGLRSGDGPLSIRIRPSSLKAAPRPALPAPGSGLGEAPPGASAPSQPWRSR